MKSLKLKLAAILGSYFLISCVGDDTPEARLPDVSTAEVSGIANTTAVSGGVVNDAGSSAILAKGVCWSTAPNPTITDSKTNEGTGTGIYSSNLIELTANTLYYVRAYASNSEGTSYGDELSFTTTNIPASGTFVEQVYDIVTDREGNTSVPSGGGATTCLFVDGVFFDMDPYAVSYSVLFYDMTRILGDQVSYPTDFQLDFAADAGNEIYSGPYGTNQILTNWYNVSGNRVTRFTEDQRLFVMASWCTTGGCEADDCALVTGKAKVTVRY